MGAMTKTRARSAAETAWGHPYVKRIVEDAELRDNVRQAVGNARSAYGRVAGTKPAKLVDDKKLHKELRSAADSLRDVSVALRDGPKRKRRGGFGKLLFVGVVGSVIAVVVNEGLRNKVLDALFGAEEEFDYSATTTPPPPPAAAPAPAATPAPEAAVASEAAKDA